jgi:hypothetical protein
VDTITVSAARTSAETAVPGPLRRIAGKLFGDDGFGFKDVLDLVNPLQHIPVVGNVYRKLTGDEIAPGMRVAGGALFGGPVGAALSMLAMAVEAGAREDTAEPAPHDAEHSTDAVAVANAPPETAPRGGWLLAAATTGRIEAFAPAGRSSAATTALVAHESAARGGWLLAAATQPVATPRTPPPAASPELPARRESTPLSAHDSMRMAALFAALQAEDEHALALLRARV